MDIGRRQFISLAFCYQPLFLLGWYGGLLALISFVLGEFFVNKLPSQGSTNHSKLFNFSNNIPHFFLCSFTNRQIHCNIIIGTNIDSICKSYVILSIRYIPRNSIGFINRIPRYIRDRLLYTQEFYRIYLQNS